MSVAPTAMLIAHGSMLSWTLYSGFLVDGQEKPGGGGLMIFEAASYESAHAWVTRDPMIHRGLVTWSLHVWRPVCADALPSSQAW